MAADAVGALRVGPGLLARGSGDGPLADRTCVAKDLIDVAGHRTGAGNPDWLEDAEVAATHAPAVQRLLDAGDAAAMAGEEAAAALAQVLGDDGVLVLPAAVGPAPPTDAPPDTLRDTAARTLGLTCLAGLIGAPQLSMPLARV